MNCAGFIKIDTSRVAEGTDAYVEVLDGSRVHPETYEWARKMAVDALEVDDSADPTAALEEILESPERLKDLDLDAFADELQRQVFLPYCRVYRAFVPFRASGTSASHCTISEPSSIIATRICDNRTNRQHARSYSTC